MKRSVEWRITQSIKPSNALQSFLNIDELLSKVLEHCLPQDYYPSVGPFVEPVSFTLVCRNWRRVALHTPELWSRLRLVEVDSPIAAALIERDAAILKRWLSRSGARPFSLLLQYELEPGYVYSHVTSLMSILASHSSRLYDLDLRCPAICLRPLLDALGRNGTLLNRLKLHIPKGKSQEDEEEEDGEESDIDEDEENSDSEESALSENSPEPHGFPKTSEAMPTVKDMELSGAARLTMDDIQLDFSNLLSLRELVVTGNGGTIFKWSGPPRNPIELDLMDLKPVPLEAKNGQSVVRGLSLLYLKPYGSLTSFANYFGRLEILRIRIILNLFSDITQKMSPVKFPLLKKLQIDLYSTEGRQNEMFLTDFLPHITCPSLEEFRLDSLFLLSLWEEKSLPEFLRRSHPPLKSLFLIKMRISEQTIIEVLGQCPVLSKLFLSLQYSQLSDAILQSLTAVNYNEERSFGGLCPLLQEINLGSRDKFTPLGVTNLVLSRNGQSAQEQTDMNVVETTINSKQRCKLKLLRLVLRDKEKEEVLANPEVIKCKLDGLQLSIIRPY